MLLREMPLMLKERGSMRLRAIGIDRFAIEDWIRVIFRFVSLLRKGLIIRLNSFSLVNWLWISIIYQGVLWRLFLLVTRGSGEISEPLSVETLIWPSLRNRESRRSKESKGNLWSIKMRLGLRSGLMFKWIRNR